MAKMVKIATAALAGFCQKKNKESRKKRVYYLEQQIKLTGKNRKKK